MTANTPLVDRIRLLWAELKRRVGGGHPDDDRAPVAAADGLDEAIPWAQEATTASDWREASRRWSVVLEQFGSIVPAKVFSRLAIAHRELGELDTAAEVLDQGRSRFPDDRRLATNWAQLAMVTEDWEEAVRRWEDVLERFEEVPPKVYAWFAISYRELGATGVAAALLDWAYDRFPDDVRIAMERVEIDLHRGDWEGAVLLCQEILDRFGTEAPPKVYARLSIAYRELGDFERSERTIQRGMSEFPDAPELAIDWAQLAAEQDDWREATARWATVFDRFNDAVPAKVFARAAAEYRHQGLVGTAVELIRQGHERFPDDGRLVYERANIAMVQQDWMRAIGCWDEVVRTARVEMEEERAGDGERGSGSGPWVFDLPLRGPNNDWHEGAWQALARAWPDDQEVLGSSAPSVWLYGSIAEVLRASEGFLEASRILRSGLNAYPQNSELTFWLVRNEIDVRRDEDDRVDPTALLDRVLGEVAGSSRSGSPNGNVDLIRDGIRLESNRAVLEDFAPGNRPHGLPKIHRIRVPRGSSLELELRAGQYLTQPTVQRLVRKLSENEGWPELEEGNEPLMERAREVSELYSHTYGELPYLPAEKLAEAVFFLIYSEMCVFEPIRRLARSMAEQRGEPVFVEVPSSTFTYLNGYAENNLGKFEFGQVYLYFELRRRGVNAFLCEPVSPEHVSRTSHIVFAPSSALMQSRPVERRPRIPQSGAAVVPAGIRSIERVIERIGDPLLISSGFIIKKYAYDRWFRKGRSLDLECSIHPPRHLLPTVRMQLWTAAKLEGTQVAGGDPQPVRAEVQVSETISNGWLDWFDHVMREYLVELSRHAHAEVALRDITEAHVCDHLFTESSILAGAVQAQGGRIVMWPHSTNPVHSEVRDPSSFDVVHAVTRAGAERWRAKFPGKEVIHDGSLMLPPPMRENQIDPERPLSVVVLGGKTTLGAMPFVHQSRHEESYRRFFEGLGRLQSDHRIEVFYKPKGFLGENESWLESTVGASGNWRTVTEHPLRIELPNMLFVSLSVGSSALFEGLSRGIPCLIVRDFPTNEYTTFESGAVPIGPSDEMLEIVRRCTDPGAFGSLIDRQLEYYRHEAGLASEVSATRDQAL